MSDVIRLEYRDVTMRFAEAGGGTLTAQLLAKSALGSYREQLLARLRQAGLELDVNDERVLREIALFADRCDVTEELTRLRSHFEQFTALVDDYGTLTLPSRTLGLGVSFWQVTR